MSITLESLKKKREELVKSLESAQKQLQDLEQTRQILAAQILEIRGQIRAIEQLIIESTSETSGTTQTETTTEVKEDISNTI